MRTCRGILALAAVAVVASACSDSSEPSGSNPTLPETGFARVGPPCATQNLAKLSRDYFSNPEQQEAADLLKLMEGSCAAADYAGAVSGGWGVLGAMERALASDNAGSPSDGAFLANELVKYMCGIDGALLGNGLCPFGLDSIAPVTAGDLGPQGIFAVRETGSDPIVARGAVPFTDFDAVQNEALWGLEVATTWGAAVGAPAPPVLIYGAPTAASTLTAVAELSFGDLGYELNTFPNVDGFAGQIQVGACFQRDVPVPHSDGDDDNPATELGERLQREGTLLQGYSPGFSDWCDPKDDPAGETSASGFLGTMRTLAARAFLPRPLFAAFFGDRKAASVGGTAVDFSTFAPVAANRSGALNFVEPPAGAFEDGTAGTNFAPIIVEALSGEGTPMELVKVELYVAGNEGTEAGATFCDPDVTDPSQCKNPVAFTIETNSGYGTVATFTGVTLYKAGGYRVCARALASDGKGSFDFTEACSELFNLKNSN